MLLAEIEMTEGWTMVGAVGGIALAVAFALLIVVVFRVTGRR